MNGFVIAGMLLFLVVWSLGMAWKSGHLQFLGKVLKLGPRELTLKTAGNKNEPYTPRRFENVVFLIFVLSTLNLSHYIANCLLLYVLYGVSRVSSEGLHFTSMLNGRPWIVSNGDQVATDLHALHFVIWVVIWLVPTWVGFVLIRRLLTKSK